ncbi:MAG: hypothetical protein PHT69_07360 [Bacteroidales bacterium]|nr:hypothetical protein [Bacteroidales bacterium]
MKNYDILKKSTVLILALCLFTHILKSQEHEDLNIYEDSLKNLAPAILYGANDFIKNEANTKFSDLLWEVLNLEHSFKYPFDSLKTISVLTSPDKYFRIFTWNLRKMDGSFDFFGMIQMNPQKKDGDFVFRMTNDKMISNTQAVQEVLSCNNWYGAHYYKLIMEKYRGKKFYTLLGWDGNNNISSRKIIDIVSFENEEPQFGAPVFQTKEILQTRFIIEYGAHVSVSLKYEKQYLNEGKNKRVMIVFDRVSPIQPMLEGHYQFYVPETNVFDAFVFKNGIWQLFENVDARTKDIPRREQRRRQMEIQRMYPSEPE